MFPASNFLHHASSAPGGSTAAPAAGRGPRRAKLCAGTLEQVGARRRRPNSRRDWRPTTDSRAEVGRGLEGDADDEEKWLKELEMPPLLRGPATAGAVRRRSRSRGSFSAACARLAFAARGGKERGNASEGFPSATTAARPRGARGLCRRIHRCDVEGQPGSRGEGVGAPRRKE